jgi:hypothetical protein
MRLRYLLCSLSMSILACNSSDKQAAPPAPTEDQPLKTAKYSPAFGTSLDGIIKAYGDMTSAIGQGDTTQTNLKASVLLTQLNGLSFTDLQKDTAQYKTAQQQQANTAGELKGLIGDQSMKEKNTDLNMVSQDLFDLLRTVGYAQSKKIYFTQCSSALGEDNPGYWIGLTSDSTQVQNPYQVGSHCAQIMDSLPAHP